MKRFALFLLCAAAFGAPFRADWESLKNHPVPEWLIDAKFGIYAHWGVYAVPAAGNEWYAKRMYDPAGARSLYEHHRKAWGPQDKFGYKDFVPMFRAEKFNPEEWADAIRGSGARYAGIAVIHHDGFALWHSKVNRWNAGEMGPKRDLYGELVKSLRARGMKIVATEHHMRTFDWFLPMKPEHVEQARRMNFDLFDPRYADFYWNHFTSTKPEFLKQWKAKLLEVIDNYRPDVLWFDGGDFTSGDVADFVTTGLAHYFNSASKWKAQVEVLNKFAGNKKFNFPREFGILTFEAGRDRPPVVDRPWIDDLSIAVGTWGYVKDMRLQPIDETICGFVDRVARGGGLLLSLAPMANGELPADQKAFLREMGDWLRVNGEAIYGTRPWKIHAEGDTEKLIVQREKNTGWSFAKCTAEDIRFTTKGGVLYAFALAWPENGRLLIKSLPAGVKDVTMLGAGKVKWSQSAAGLSIQMPAKQPCKHAWAFRIALK